MNSLLKTVPNARHHPPRTQTSKPPKLTMRGTLIRGRVHAVVKPHSTLGVKTARQFYGNSRGPIVPA